MKKAVLFTVLFLTSAIGFSQVTSYRDNTKATNSRVDALQNQVNAIVPGGEFKVSGSTGLIVGTQIPASNLDAWKIVASTSMVATGTPSASTYLRGDNSWTTPAGGGGKEYFTKVIKFGANDGTADYYCDGTDDDIQFQQALDSMALTGGTVVIREGTYTFKALGAGGLGITSYPSINFIGNGNVKINVENAPTNFKEYNNIENIYFYSSTTFAIVESSDIILSNCKFGVGSETILFDLRGNRNKIINCQWGYSGGFSAPAFTIRGNDNLVNHCQINFSGSMGDLGIIILGSDNIFSENIVSLSLGMFGSTGVNAHLNSTNLIVSGNRFKNCNPGVDCGTRTMIHGNNFESCAGGSELANTGTTLAKDNIDSTGSAWLAELP